MSYAKLIFGLFLFANPYFGPIDYLPDFLGLLLIAGSIKDLSDVSPSAEAAIGYFKKAAIVSAAQIAVYIPLLSMISAEPSFNLLYSSAIAILRLVFLIPAFIHLFNCFYYFAQRSASDAKRIRTLKISVLAFTVFHAIFSALPEIVYLKVYKIPADTDAGYVAYFPLSYYRTGVMVLCAFIVLVVGLIWFILSTVLIHGIKKNKAFNSAIVTDVSNAERSAKKTVLKSLSPAIFLLSAAAFTSFSYFIDGKPMIPPYLAPILHLIAIGYIRNMCAKKVTRGFSIAAIFFGLLMQLGCEMFAFASHDRALFAFNDVKTQFMLPLCLNALYTLMMILSLISICRAICALIKEHTGLFWESAFITHNAKVGNDKLKQLFFTRFLTLLASASAIFSLISYAQIYFNPTLNLISVGVSLVLGFAFSTLLSSIKNSVIEKYSTDNKMN